MPSDFMAHGLGDDSGHDTSRGRYQLPALLVSFWYWSTFAKERPRYRFRDYSLDSGAFSAWKSGAEVDVDAYTEFCAQQLAEDDQLVEVFALDVVGDWRATIANTEKAWEAGVPAIPTYHVGEPEHVLKHLAKTYPKIALGGAVGMRGRRKIEWARQCFARVWPKPIHGLGFGSRDQVMALPFHSVDATSWEAGPTRFGNWKSMPGGSIRGGQQPLRMEVEWYLRLEQEAQARWRNEMRQLDDMLTTDTDAPAVRFAAAAHLSDRRVNAFGGPSVRLATPSKRSKFIERGLGDDNAPAIRLAVSGMPKGNKGIAVEGDDQEDQP